MFAGSSLLILTLSLLLSAIFQSFPQPWILPPLQRFLFKPQDSIISTQVLSVDPMMLYLHDFLSPSEIQHLLTLGAPLFQRSLIKDGTVSPFRTSESCFLPGNDSIVSLIKTRAHHLLGGLAYDGLEAIQLVRYYPGQKVNLHYDWSKEPKLDRQGRKYNRLASFFIYLQDECTGGETWFPNVTVSEAGRLGRERIKQGHDDRGTSVVASKGSGLFWINLGDDGTGDRRTLHAGLPVGEGVKVGMNVWVKRLL
jgi:prolyl 4-hydroxylase